MNENNDAAPDIVDNSLGMRFYKKGVRKNG